MSKNLSSNNYSILILCKQLVYLLLIQLIDLYNIVPNLCILSNQNSCMFCLIAFYIYHKIIVILRYTIQKDSGANTTVCLPCKSLIFISSITSSISGPNAAPSTIAIIELFFVLCIVLATLSLPLQGMML